MMKPLPPPPRLSRTPPASGHLAYLDGLRTLAIIAVLVYHQDNAWLPGGYLGVEVFFVISGFIITHLLYKEWSGSQRIGFGLFYSKRFKRLSPSMLVMALAVSVWLVWRHPDNSLQIRTDLPYALGFMGNLQYIFAQRSYFETIDRPVFGHLWSLGVEFQFYLLWPLLCLFWFRLPLWAAATLLVAGATASYGWMAALYLHLPPDQDPSRLYFGTDTRVGAFLVGALAWLWVRGRKPPRELQGLSALLALAVFEGLLLALYLLDTNNLYLYKGGFAAIAVLTALMIAHCHLSHRHDPLALLLGNPLTAWLGERSYGIYLWHWPVFCLSLPFVDVPLEGGKLFALRLAVTLACAELSHRLVEKPIRQGSLGRIWPAFNGAPRQRWQAVGVAALLLGAGIYGCERLIRATQAAFVQAAAAMPVAATRIDGEDEDMPIPPVFVVSVLIANPPPVYLHREFSPPFLGPHIGKPDVVIARASGHLPTQVVWDKNPANGYILRVRNHPKAKAAYLAIGDSVMVGAAAELLRQKPDLMMDAKVGRQLVEAVPLLGSADQAQASTVLVHLGNNGPFNQAQVNKLVNSLKNGQRLVLVNLKLPRNYEATNNRILEKAAEHPGVKLVNWRSVGLAAKDVFASDGLHLTAKGIRLYTQTLLKALNEADHTPPTASAQLKPLTEASVGRGVLAAGVGRVN